MSEEYEHYVGEALQVHVQAQHIEALEAENAQLREALEGVMVYVAYPRYVKTSSESQDIKGKFERRVARAKAALSDTARIQD